MLRQGGAYRLENVFDGVVVHRAADRVKPYVGRGVPLQQQEVFGQEDEDVETRPVRQRRPPERYGEE